MKFNLWAMAGCVFVLAGVPARSAEPTSATDKPTEPAAPASTVSAEIEPDVESVMRTLEKRMADIRSVQAAFVQEKTLSILDSKVVIEGTMALEGERFAWHVNAPVKYSMVLIDDAMRQWDEDTGRVQRQSLKGNPVFNAVMEQLGHWFSGRYRQLRSDYAVTLLEREPMLRLRFSPRAESAAAKAVKHVTVSFRDGGEYIHGIAIEDLSGDTTVLTFSDTVVNEPIAPETWRVGAR